MFKSKSHGDIKKSSQKVLDYKKDTFARLKHLKIVIDTLEAHDLKNFFEVNFSHIYYIFYEVFVQIEVERRQKGYRIHKDEFDLLLELLEKILLLLPGLIQRRWQFHSLGRIMKKLLHSGNSLKVRSEGLRLFVIWYQILQENNSNENHAIFARLAQITDADAAYFEFGDHGLATSENPVCTSEINAVQPPSSAEKPSERLCTYFLELLLTYVVSEVSKVEWSNPVQKQACFIFLFESIKQHYVLIIFPSFERRTTIYPGCAIAEKSLTRLSDAYIDHGEVLSASQMEDCRDVIVRWFTNFVQMSRLQQNEEPSAAIAEKSSAAEVTTEDGKDTGVAVPAATFHLPSSSGIGGSTAVAERLASEAPAVGLGSARVPATSSDITAVRASSNISTAAVPSQPGPLIQSSKAGCESDSSDANDSASSSSDDGAHSPPNSEQHDFSQYEIVRNVLFGTRENVDIIHEVFRQAFMLPMRLAGGIRRVVAVYKEWLQMPVHRPIFLQDPPPPLLAGRKQATATDLSSAASSAVGDLAEVGSGRRRPYSYIAAVKSESTSGSCIGRDGLSIRAGLRNSVLLFIQHSSCVFEKEAAGEPVPTQVKLCLQVLNLYRYIVMKLNLDQQTWEQLLCVLLKISMALLGEHLHNLELAKELAAPVLQTLIVTWIKANLYVHVSSELWDSLLDTLSALTSWRELISEWAKTMDTLTRILAKHVYNLDLSDLPLDRMSELKSRRLRATSMVPQIKEKKTATFSRAYTGLDSTGAAVPASQQVPAIPGGAASVRQSLDGSSRGPATDEEDEFVTLANRRHVSGSEVKSSQLGPDGSPQAQQHATGPSSALRLPRSNSDSNIAESVERQRGTSYAIGIDSSQLRSSLAPSKSSPPVTARDSDSTVWSGVWTASGQPAPSLPPPVPARPKVHAAAGAAGLGKSDDNGPPPPPIPPPPLPPPPRLAKRHAPELGHDLSAGVDMLPGVRRGKDMSAPGCGGSSSGEPSPASARRGSLLTLGSTSSADKTSGSLMSDTFLGAAVYGITDSRKAQAETKMPSSASLVTVAVAHSSPEGRTSAMSGDNHAPHSRHTSDREDSLIQMDFFATPWINQEAASEDGFSALTLDSWNTAATAPSTDNVCTPATAALLPDETVSVASTDDYRIPYYDLIVDAEQGTAGGMVDAANGGSNSNTYERSELQALLGAASESSSSLQSSVTSSSQIFNYMRVVDEEADAPSTAPAAEGSPPMYTPPSSPSVCRPDVISDTAVRRRRDAEACQVTFKQETPDRESLDIDETSQDPPDAHSVIFGGHQRGWTPAMSVVLWRRMLGILGNPNAFSSVVNHAAVFDYLLELLTVILKMADNQGIVAGSQQGTPPPPEVAAPVLFLAPICFKAQELGDEYRSGKLTALQMLCTMTLRHVYSPAEEGYLAQFYMAVHRGLISNDQDIINVLVKYLCPNLFGLDLPGGTMLVMDVINAAGSVVALAAVKEAPRKEGVTLLGSLVCFPNHYHEIPVLYEDQSELCPLPGKHMKDCLIELLTMVGKNEPTAAARCIALSSLGIYLVEELASGTCHGDIKSIISVLLQNLKAQTPASVSHVACDILTLLSEHITSIRKMKADLPSRIVLSLVTQLTDQVAASPESDENLIVSLMFCLLHWCTALEMQELLGTVSVDSLLRRVFAALCPTATNCERQLLVPHSSSGAQPEPDGSSASSTTSHVAAADMLLPQMSSTQSMSADVTDHDGNSLSSNHPHTLLKETERVQAAAKYVICHLVNHLGNYPVESETMPLLSSIQEHHDLTVPDDRGNERSLPDDLTAAVFSSPNLQVFVYNGSALISCMEIEKRDIDVDVRYVSTNTTTRLLVRDITGKYCWNAALIYGQQRKLPLHELDTSTLRLSSSSAASDSLDTAGTDDMSVQAADELTQVLRRIAETAPECQLIPGLPLDVPYPPADESAAQLEDDVVEHLLRQQSDDNQYYAEHQADFRMTAFGEEAPAYQEPLSAFLQSRQYLHQFGFLSWENRQKVELLQKNDRLLRELKNLDNQLRSRETHKIAVIYVAKGQEDKRSVLGNNAGSEAFERFVAGLGWEVDLSTHVGFMGGLQRDGKTGDTAPYYATAAVEVLYHVSTRMPGTSDDDQHRKLKHLGNDEVHIVWSEHYREYRRGIISTEFGDAMIIIYPLQSGLYRVRIDKKPEVPFFGPLFDGAIVSRRALPSLVRATAINASRQQRLTLPYFHPFFVQRARSIEKIAKECHKPSTFETFAANVFSPAQDSGEASELSSTAAGPADRLDGEAQLCSLDTSTATKKGGSPEPSVAMRARRMLSVKRGRSLLQRRHTDFPRSSSPPAQSPSPTTSRKK